MSPRKPQDTTLENRRWASRRRLRTPNQAKEASESVWHDAGKPTSSVLKPTLDISADKPRDAIRHDARKPTPSVRQLIIPNQAKKRLGMP
jgi:hypothetical protein